MKATAGGVIAIILLAIYVYLIGDGCIIVSSKGTSGLAFNDVMSQTLSVIGGLISALVIAELAVTKPGETPVARILSPDASDRSKNALKWISGLYLVVWLMAGLTAFLVGMVNPNQLQPLTSVGQSWFGLAVAAAYAYFGLKPD